MKLLLVTIASLMCTKALARPQQPAQQGPSTPVSIVSQTEQINPDGSFKYSYETSNGIKVEQTGEVKPDPNATASARSADGEEAAVIQVLRGSYSYTDPEGTLIQLSYVADENGFQPEGDHLPKSPAAAAGAEAPSGAAPVASARSFSSASAGAPQQAAQPVIAAAQTTAAQPVAAQTEPVQQ